ncbi:MAG: hypothetical protein QM496_04750 [Verrucomicrobiota bacterium]
MRAKNHTWCKTMTSAVSVAAALHLITGAIAETPKSGLETNKWELAGDQSGLLPETESVYGAVGVEHLEKQLGRKLTKEERALLLRDASGKWKTFSDDLVSFDLPDDPLLSVKVFTPKQNPKLRIVGGAVILSHCWLILAMAPDRLLTWSFL